MTEYVKCVRWSSSTVITYNVVLFDPFRLYRVYIDFVKSIKKKFNRISSTTMMSTFTIGDKKKERKKKRYFYEFMYVCILLHSLCIKINKGRRTS